MQDLGQLGDLAESCRAVLAALYLVPLWPGLRAVLPPGKASRRTHPVHWSYAEMRPLLMQAGEMSPIEKAGRRVPVLANPGHGQEKMQASPSIYLGMQLLLPGEWTPAHRHTPNAVRMIVEGKGAYTKVDGENCPMRRGDLILTAAGLSHEHGHDGKEPVVWFDVLHLPLVYYMEASYVTEGQEQTVAREAAERAYQRGGVTPSPVFARADKRFAMLRYPWAELRAALVALAASQPGSEAVQVACVDPETGCDCQAIPGFSALMLTRESPCGCRPARRRWCCTRSKAAPKWSSRTSASRWPRPIPSALPARCRSRLRTGPPTSPPSYSSQTSLRCTGSSATTKSATDHPYEREQP